MPWTTGSSKQPRRPIFATILQESDLLFSFSAKSFAKLRLCERNTKWKSKNFQFNFQVVLTCPCCLFHPIQFVWIDKICRISLRSRLQNSNIRVIAWLSGYKTGSCKMQKFVKNRTAVQLNLHCGAPIVTPQSKFICTAVRFFLLFSSRRCRLFHDFFPTSHGPFTSIPMNVLAPCVINDTSAVISPCLFGRVKKSTYLCSQICERSCHFLRKWAFEIKKWA